MATPAAVVVASDSVTSGSVEDRSGAAAVELLSLAGFAAGAPTPVSDDVEAIRAAVRGAIDGGARLVVVTGGTGMGPRDVTPEALLGLGSREFPGVGEAIRAASRAGVPSADLSRALAVTVGKAFVLGVPGSTGGVRDALAVAIPLAGHALAMLDGQGHGHGEGHSHVPGAAVQGVSGIRAESFTTIECERMVQDPAAGAVALFAGVVRDHDHGQEVASLSYEAHPDASTVMAGIVAEARALPGVIAAAALHREGDLAVGDLAFAAAVSAPHRAEAFAACAWLVDEVKSRAPIWKHQRFADGTEEWVNCP